MYFDLWCKINGLKQELTSQANQQMQGSKQKLIF